MKVFELLYGLHEAIETPFLDMPGPAAGPTPVAQPNMPGPAIGPTPAQPTPVAQPTPSTPVAQSAQPTPVAQSAQPTPVAQPSPNARPPTTPVAQPTPTAAQPPNHVGTFMTDRGSTYHVLDSGQTIRDKSLHLERGHSPQDVGFKEPSSQTFYLPRDQIHAWASAQQRDSEPGNYIHTEQPTLRQVVGDPEFEGHWGVQFQGGPNAGKWERGSLIKPQTTPAVGLRPVEVWHNPPGHPAAGQPEYNNLHFGNTIVAHYPNEPMTIQDVKAAGGMRSVAARNAAAAGSPTTAPRPAAPTPAAPTPAAPTSALRVADPMHPWKFYSAPTVDRPATPTPAAPTAAAPTAAPRPATPMGRGGIGGGAPLGGGIGGGSKLSPWGDMLGKPRPFT